MDRTTAISRKGKIMMLAYDQGFEHGPTDFNEKNYDPNYILDIAWRDKYTCVALQYGIAEKFWKGKFEDVPLVVKLNGKTSMVPSMYSVTNTSVEEAVKLGAKAVGFTLYLGGDHEAEMIREFSHIRRQAHSLGLAVIAWVYPFITLPSSSDDERDAKIVAYAARAGAELGADVVKIKYPHQPEALPWIIKNAVGTKAILSGGDKATEEEFLSTASNFMNAGGAGVAVGRNVWQDDSPHHLSLKLAETIFGKP